METSTANKILLVDDDAHQLMTISDCLTFCGFDVQVAHDGDEAIKALQAKRPDLILLDVMMPVIHGGKVALSIRADPETADIPIVFMTAVINREEAETRYGIARSDPFVRKPIELDELIQVVRQHIRK